MKTNVFIGISDSVIFREVLNRFLTLPFEKQRLTITLVHVFRKATNSEQLMGEDYITHQIEQFTHILKLTKQQLINNGYTKEQIAVNLIENPYPTIADGLIDQFKKGEYHMVVLGRKRMSKAEEFVLGDPCTKLIRYLEKTCVLIIKGS
ncbi:universal stress protein [Desulfobacula sp.]|uniref:universal stress protein n=1 Tax=Desulfobacula sp. TaxID=2593537 RepID=UPI0026395231|nr:universal stress protein [Desulfobacula sp.]